MALNILFNKQKDDSSSNEKGWWCHHKLAPTQQYTYTTLSWII